MVGAKSALSIYLVQWDRNKKSEANTTSTSDPFKSEYQSADPETMRWEAEVIRRLEDAAKVMSDEDPSYEFFVFFDRRYGSPTCRK